MKEDECSFIFNMIIPMSKTFISLFLKNTNYPTVITADNLASGKGVYICGNENESNIAINEIFDGKFGKAENI